MKKTHLYCILTEGFQRLLPSRSSNRQKRGAGGASESGCTVARAGSRAGGTASGQRPGARRQPALPTLYSLYRASLATHSFHILPRLFSQPNHVRRQGYRSSVPRPSRHDGMGTSQQNCQFISPCFVHTHSLVSIKGLRNGRGHFKPARCLRELRARAPHLPRPPPLATCAVTVTSSPGMSAATSGVDAVALAQLLAPLLQPLACLFLLISVAHVWAATVTAAATQPAAASGGSTGDAPADVSVLVQRARVQVHAAVCVLLVWRVRNSGGAPNASLMHACICACNLRCTRAAAIGPATHRPPPPNHPTGALQLALHLHHAADRADQARQGSPANARRTQPLCLFDLPPGGGGHPAAAGAEVVPPAPHPHFRGGAHSVLLHARLERPSSHRQRVSGGWVGLWVGGWVGWGVVCVCVGGGGGAGRAAAAAGGRGGKGGRCRGGRQPDASRPRPRVAAPFGRRVVLARSVCKFTARPTWPLEVAPCGGPVLVISHPGGPQRAYAALEAGKHNGHMQRWKRASMGTPVLIPLPAWLPASPLLPAGRAARGPLGGSSTGGRWRWVRAALRCAVLCCAVLCCAVLCCAVLCACPHPWCAAVRPGWLESNQRQLWHSRRPVRECERVINVCPPLSLPRCQGPFAGAVCLCVSAAAAAPPGHHCVCAAGPGGGGGGALLREAKPCAALLQRIWKSCKA